MPASIAAALAVVLLLGGCGGRLGGAEGGFLGFGRSSGPAAQAAAAVPPADPVAAFAAQSRPGVTGRVTLPDGQPASVRLVRAYISAGGRECREVAVGSGMTERSQLVCMTETGWAPARPLLRGGGVGRP